MSVNVSAGTIAETRTTDAIDFRLTLETEVIKELGFENMHLTATQIVEVLQHQRQNGDKQYDDYVRYLVNEKQKFDECRETMDKELFEMENRLSDVLGHKESLIDQKEELIIERNGLLEDKKELEKEISEQNSKIESLESSLKYTEKERNTQNYLAIQYAATIKKMIDEIDDKNQSIKNLQYLREQSTLSYEQENRINKGHVSTIEHLRGLHNMQMETMETQKRTIEQLQIDLKAMDTKLKDTVKLANRNYDALSASIAENAKVHEKCDVLTKQKEQLEEQVMQLHEHVKFLEESKPLPVVKVTDMNNVVRQMYDTQTELEKRFKETEITVQTLTDEREDLQRRVDKLQTQLEKTTIDKDKIQSLSNMSTHNLLYYQNKCATYETIIEQLHENCKNITNENDRLAQENRTLKEEVEHITKQLLDSRCEVDMMNADRQPCSEESDFYIKECRDLERANTLLEEQNYRLTENAELLKERCDKLTENAELLKERCDKLTEANRLLKERITILKKHKKMLRTTLDSYNDIEDDADDDIKCNNEDNVDANNNEDITSGKPGN
jgi:chromosome segregation ATPase